MHLVDIESHKSSKENAFFFLQMKGTTNEKKLRIKEVYVIQLNI